MTDPNRAARRHPKPRSAVPRAYVSVLEACEYLGLSEKTVRRLIDRGDLTAYVFGTRRKVVRLKIAELDSVYTAEVRAVGE